MVKHFSLFAIHCKALRLTLSRQAVPLGTAIILCAKDGLFLLEQ